MDPSSQLKELLPRAEDALLSWAKCCLPKGHVDFFGSFSGNFTYSTAFRLATMSMSTVTLTLPATLA